jgi:hypothetical protein
MRRQVDPNEPGAQYAVELLRFAVSGGYQYADGMGAYVHEHCPHSERLLRAAERLLRAAEALALDHPPAIVCICPTARPLSSATTLLGRREPADEDATPQDARRARRIAGAGAHRRWTEFHRAELVERERGYFGTRRKRRRISPYRGDSFSAAGDVVADMTPLAFIAKAATCSCSNVSRARGRRSSTSAHARAHGESDRGAAVGRNRAASAGPIRLAITV